MSKRLKELKFTRLWCSNEIAAFNPLVFQFPKFTSFLKKTFASEWLKCRIFQNTFQVPACIRSRARRAARSSLSFPVCPIVVPVPRWTVWCWMMTRPPLFSLTSDPVSTSFRKIRTKTTTTPIITTATTRIKLSAKGWGCRKVLFWNCVYDTKTKKTQQPWSIKTSFSRNFVGEKLSKGLIEAK